MPESLHFLNSRLTVLTAFSTLPLDWGYLGDDGVCSKFHCFANLENSAESNYGPLSEITVSGTPYLANISFIGFMTLLDVVVVSRSTSTKLL